MNRTHRLRLVLCTLLCFVLCSCQTVLPANEKAQVEELLRAPKLSGDYGALQTALNDWLGESAQLKYPIQGSCFLPLCCRTWTAMVSRTRRCCIPPPRPPTSA